MPALVRLPLLEADADEAAQWYERQKPGFGGEFLDAFETQHHTIAEAPWRYAIRFSDVRRCNLKRFPDGLFFFLHGEFVVVLGVLHHQRDSRAVLERRRQAVPPPWRND